MIVEETYVLTKNGINRNEWKRICGLQLLFLYFIQNMGVFPML